MSKASMTMFRATPHTRFVDDVHRAVETYHLTWRKGFLRKFAEEYMKEKPDADRLINYMRDIEGHKL